MEFVTVFFFFSKQEECGLQGLLGKNEKRHKKGFGDKFWRQIVSGNGIINLRHSIGKERKERTKYIYTYIYYFLLCDLVKFLSKEQDRNIEGNRILF